MRKINAALLDQPRAGFIPEPSRTMPCTWVCVKDFAGVEVAVVALIPRAGSARADLKVGATFCRAPAGGARVSATVSITMIVTGRWLTGASRKQESELCAL